MFIFRKFWICVTMFLYFWCVLNWFFIFDAFIGLGVFFCIYDDSLKILLYIFWNNVLEVWTIFVRTVFLRLFGIFGVLNGPPTPIPGINVKVPFRGKLIWKIMFFLRIVCDFYKKIEKCTVTTFVLTFDSSTHIENLILKHTGSDSKSIPNNLENGAST